MPVVSVDFKKSREAERQRYVRSIIRKTKRNTLTKAERDVLLTMVNLWFYHKCGPNGFIHPGRSKIAKRADVSVVTVARALARLRAYGFIDPTDYAKGGRKATRYFVDVDCIIETLNPHGVQTHPGILMAFPSVQNDTVSQPLDDTVLRYQNDTRYKETGDGLNVGDDYLPIDESLIDYSDVWDA